MMWRREKKTPANDVCVKWSVLRLFRPDEKTEPSPNVLCGFEKSDLIISFDPQMWKLSEIALLDAERRKAQVYATRLHNSLR